jgi:excisionase family DNA binding protein
MPALKSLNFLVIAEWYILEGIEILKYYHHKAATFSEIAAQIVAGGVLYQLSDRDIPSSAQQRTEVRMVTRSIPDPEPRLWLQIKEAARMMSVTPRTIHRWIAEGKIEATTKFGRTKVLRQSLLVVA